MQTKNHLFKIPFSWLFLAGVFLLVGVSCSQDADPLNDTAQDPLTEAKAGFSDALSLWNQPENFDRSTGKTENELLQYRLELVYEDAKNLLLASGMTEEQLLAKNKEAVFIAAIQVYGEHYHQNN